MSTACHHHRRRLLLLNPPPVKPTKLSSSMSRNSHFDSNMMLILGAMLCSLIAALVLNSIVRCALRCRRRVAFESPDGVAARSASTGLKKDALIQIPIVVFKSGIDTPETECPICLGEFGEGEEVRILPNCNHSFHVKCIDAWLASHSSCPTCRQLLIGNPSRV